MKKYISILMIFAVALLFVGQSDALAKTAKEATAELSKDNDGVTYYQLKAPKTFKAKSILEIDKADAPRADRLFTVEIISLQNREIKFWDQVVEKIYKIYYKYIAVVK